MDALAHFPLTWMVLLSLGAFFVVTFYFWIRFEDRDERKYRGLGATVLFHCVKCGELFQVRGQKETADCPACGKNNLRLRF